MPAKPGSRYDKGSGTRRGAVGGPEGGAKYTEEGDMHPPEGAKVHHVKNQGSSDHSRMAPNSPKPPRKVPPQE